MGISMCRDRPGGMLRKMLSAMALGDTCRPWVCRFVVVHSCGRVIAISTRGIADASFGSPLTSCTESVSPA
jgi:hypothetical protein